MDEVLSTQVDVLRGRLLWREEHGGSDALYDNAMSQS